MIQVAIHGVPRSGTSWLGEIFNSSPTVTYKFQPLFSYRHKGSLKPSSTKTEINDFFASIYSSDDEFIDQREARKSGRLPVFEKDDPPSHIVYKEVRYHHVLENLASRCDQTRICLLVRSPLSVINSWLRAPREFRADLGWKVDEEWRYASKKNQDRPEEFNGYERWKEGTLLFLDLAHRFPQSVIVTQYRDLLSSPRTEVQKLFDFCKLPMTQQTVDFLTDASSGTVANESAYSVFRNSVNDYRWKDELQGEIIDAITQDLSGTPLEALLN